MFGRILYSTVRTSRNNINRYNSNVKPILTLTPYTGGQYQKRDYKNFGHKPDKIPLITRFWYSFLAISFFAICIDYRWVRRTFFPPVKAESEETVDNAEIEEGEDGKKKKHRKEKIGFRDRKIIEYENRMRAYSTPDKIFRYFATVRLIQINGLDVYYMTPDDFLRAITPGMKQPDGKGGHRRVQEINGEQAV